MIFCGKKGCGLLCILFAFLFVSVGLAQNTSNDGREFWVVFPRHEASNQALANIRLFITSKNNSTGVVQIGNTSIPFTVTAGKVTSVDVPRALAYIHLAGLFSNRGIHVLVDANQPKVSVYAHIYAFDRSAATLVLPVESLGSKYYVMGYDQHGTTADGLFSFSIVATAPNTTVLIHQQVNQSPGPTTTVTLTNVGDVYQFLGPDDYTGTYVEVDPAISACKTFALFSGSSGISIPFAINASINPLFQQLYPVNNWGKSYAYVPLSGPDRGDMIRVIAQEDNTVVTIDGIVMPINLNKGSFYSSDPIPTAGMITANKPISVAQFALSERNADSRNIALGPNYNGQFPVYSDPNMAILSPTTLSTKDITVYSTSLVGIANRFINVVMKTSACASFKVNGAAPAGAVFKPIGASDYSYMQLNVGIAPYDIGLLSSLRLTADEGFNALVYGLADFDSYTYSAGTNLSSDIFLTARDHVGQQQVLTGCKNQLLDFKLTLPYLTSELRWTLDSTIPIIIQSNPGYTSFVKDGDTLYEYLLPTSSFSSSGDKEIKVSAKLPVITAGCNNGYKDFTFDFRIYDIPQASFGALTQSCVNDAIVFSDTSNSTDSPIIQWSWDFGDGSLTSTRSPTHTYTTPGAYVATLNVIAASGCVASFTQTIKILALPLASFTSGSAICQNSSISFTDTSTPVDDPITQWFWDFGDGQTSSLQNPTHVYTQQGPFTVRLNVATSGGCKGATATSQIVVHALPQVGFEASKICYLDAVASFTNTTTISDGTDAGLSYLWDFGDSHTSVSNPVTSTLRNPSHTYSTQGSYTVTLTVKSTNNCAVTISQPFLVNGASPKAGFKVLNTDSLCSSDPVVFEDQATLDFGELARTVWFYDLDNDPLAGEIDDNPSLRESEPKKYTHQYPVFHTPPAKSYTVKMVAYSGYACLSEITQTVVLKAVPEVIFEAISNVCVDKGPLWLSARETSSFAGSGQFSGPGVSPNGLFNPSIAGVGKHTITYTFTGLNGCPMMKAQTIEVYPLPEVNAGPDWVLLRGDSVQLEANAKGNNLTYKWSPSTGLSRDDIPNPIACPEYNTTYTLMVTSADGCAKISQVFLKILQMIRMPNVFTPNGDGIDDIWVIKNLDMYPGATVEIFDRYGSRVYHSDGNYIPWDGKRNGEDLPTGTYYYLIDPKNRRNSISGYVTILR
ncbi:MAG: PKD domain-containing protein [Sphingobacteriaceae bacterium]